MTSILKVDNIQKANGSTPTAKDLGINTTGTVLKTVFAKTDGIHGTSNAEVLYLTATIAPTLSSSKILISHLVSYGGAANGYGFGRCERTVAGGSAVNLRYGDSSFGANTGKGVYASFGMQMNNSNDVYKMWSTGFNFLDTPSTTSVVTYKFFVQADASSRQIIVNRSVTDPTAGYRPPPNTTVTLTEIGG